VYLTTTERQKIKEAAARADIAGEAEELVRQAMAAIFQGEADEVAYSVTEAAGAVWLTPDIWYKEKLQVNVETARALLAQGKKDGTFEAPIPEDDAKAISEANDLVEMAQTAWDQHVRGPEVEILLKMAANGAEPKETPKEEPKETPPEDPPDEPKAEEPAPEPEPESEDSPQEGGDDLANIEPWENYDGEKVSDIISGVNAGLKEYSESEFIDLMANVWAYEAAHKGRQTILNRLEEIASKLQKGEIDDVGSEGTPPKEEPRDDDAEGSQGGEEGGEEVQEGPGDSQEGSDEGAGQGSEGPDRDAGEPEDRPTVAADEQEPESVTRGGGEPDDSAESQEGSGSDEVEPEPEKPKRKRQQKQQDEQLLDPDYEQIVRKVEEDMERERVHKPSPPEEDIPDLPWDWTKMTDKELQKFHGIYSALAYYKGYQLSREERMALHCKAAADELHNALLVRLDKYDDHGKEKKVALIEAEVESDENIVKWRRRQRKHEQFAASHRNERDSVGKLVDALSRTESMRHQEWERSVKLGRQK